MAEIIKKIALLATGDEITNGDVLNTNTQVIAEKLFAHHIQPGLHLTANDEQAEIEKAIQFLLTDHAGLIIIGGLGPTSDDRTRFALSKALKTELIFNDSCWQRIVERLQRLALAVADTNRQQCLFPANAVIFPNDNGTAAGCLFLHGQQPVFMLPGPPFECLPIFETQVLPYLQSRNYARPLFRCEWLLLGVSESNIAAQLDPLMENSGCSVGYRINTPYLEVKLKSSQPEPLAKLRAQFDALIGSQSISSDKQTASMQLTMLILTLRIPLHITDQATGGLLNTALLNPDTYPYVHFNASAADTAAIQIHISGLEHYWRKQTCHDKVSIVISYAGHSDNLEVTIPFRQNRTLRYALEKICWEILIFLKARISNSD